MIKMKDILLIGGMASGKTTLAKAMLKEDRSIHYVPMSDYVVKIPMTLLTTTHPQILELQRISQYIDTIIENRYVGIDQELFSSQRDMMDKFGQAVMDTYGETAPAEIAIRAARPTARNIIDNIPKAANVRYLQERGFYIVGLKCSFESQVQRRLDDPKGIGHADRQLLEEQVRNTNAYFKVDDSLNLADIVYNTDNIRSDSRHIVQEISMATR